MYQGYLAFGGQEVLNAERTAVYVANGHGPDGLEVNACVGDCEDFHQAISDPPYTSPIIDQPPWFDASNPDSYDFAGLIPLDITGTDGSTRVREVVPRLGDGGIPHRGHADPRTIAVSALAIARSECGLAAGISWLTAALHPPCVPQSLCGGTELDGFSCCPAPFCPTQDPDAPLAEIDHTGEEFFPISGTWDPDTDSFVVSTSGGQETNLAINPNMDAASKAAPVLLATNLVPNPGFMVNTTGWTPTAGTMSRQTANPDIGVGHAQISATGANAALAHAAIPVVAGRTYRAVARVRAGNAGAANDNVTLRLTFRNASNATTGTINGVAVPAVQANYKDLNVQGVAPAATTNVLVSLNAVSASGDIYWYDSIALFDTTEWPAGFFDGDTADTANFTFAWTGTAGNSTSTVTGPPIAATNLVPNPGFETGYAGWTPVDATTPNIDTGVFDTGAASFKYQAAAVTKTGALYYQYVFGIVPGRTYRLSSRLMQPVAGAPLRAKVVWHGESGVLGTMQSEERVLIPGQWTPLTISGVAPAGATRAVVYAFEDTQQALRAGEVVYVDSVLLARDPNPVTGARPGYFDGNSGTEFGWTGAPDLSPSVAFRMLPTGWHANDIGGNQSVGVVTQTSEQYATPADGDNLLVGASTKAIRLDLPTDAAKDGGVYLEVTGLDPETFYTLSGWVYVPAGSPNVRIEAPSITQSEPIATKDRWVYRAVVFQTGVGVTSGLVGARTVTSGAGTTAGQHFYLDAVMLTQTLGPGNTATDTPESGPANTEFENQNTIGWAGNPASGAMVEPEAIDTSTAHAKYESSSLRAVWPDPTPDTSLSGVYTALNHLIPGVLYTFAAWVYVPSGSPDVSLDLLSLAAGPTVTTKDEWVYTSVTATTPPGETTVFAGIQTAAPALGTEVYVDGVRFSRGEQALSYFDGDSVGGFWLGISEESGSVWAGPGGGTGVIAGPPYTCVDRFTATWTVTPFTGHPVTVRPVALNASGSEVLDTGPPVRVEGPGPTTVIWTARRGTWDAWRPALEVEAPGADVVLHTEESVELTLEECIAPLRRSYRNVVTVEGPTVAERIATKDGETTLARLEWTWVAADPFQYGSPDLLAQLVPSGAGDPTYIAENVQLSPPTPIAALTCPRPAPVLVSCADDPCAPGFIVPPVPPSIPDTSFPQPAGYNRRAFQIPPELVPSGLGVLTFIAHNDGSDKVGVRVRVWEDPDPDFGNVVECDFLYEFTVGYLAPNESLRIDGPDGTITATCASAVGEQNAERTVRGAYGGPFAPMVVGCTNRYHVAVDVPTTYPTTCDPAPAGDPFYTAGQPQGDLTWTFMLNRRDG